MNKQKIINQTVDYLKSKFSGENTGHDWYHIERVWKNAIAIGKQEKADMFVVELGALLHDIADFKFHGGDDSVGPKAARQWLESAKVDEIVIDKVCRIVKQVSFKGAKVKSAANFIESQVVQDADRLDALGAIGIARVFAYGGHAGHEIYNPTIKPTHHESFEKYKNARSPSVNHFYEKLLLLKDMMNTKTGKKMAQKRHKFMEKYLDEFMAEWNGKS